jgi:hypothetical protein
MTTLPPSPFLNSAATPRAADTAATPLSPPSGVAAATYSDGAPGNSLPSGESEPSVTLACAPSETNPWPEEWIEEPLRDEPLPLFLTEPAPEIDRDLLAMLRVIFNVGSEWTGEPA